MKSLYAKFSVRVVVNFILVTSFFVFLSTALTWNLLGKGGVGIPFPFSRFDSTPPPMGYLEAGNEYHPDSGASPVGITLDLLVYLGISIGLAMRFKPSSTNKNGSSADK